MRPSLIIATAPVWRLFAVAALFSVLALTVTGASFALGSTRAPLLGDAALEQDSIDVNRVIQSVRGRARPTAGDQVEASVASMARTTWSSGKTRAATTSMGRA